VLAALMVITVWLVSLVSEPGFVEGAPAAKPAAPNGFCESRLEERVFEYLRRQTRMEQSRSSQQREDERRDQAVLLEHNRLLRQEKALRTLATSRIEDLVPERYQPLVLDVAGRFDMDPRMVAAVGTVESQWYEQAVGTYGDSGLMQILPSTGEWIASKFGLEQYDLFDPVTNLTMGAWYLHVLHAEYGNWSQALAVYNGGPRAASLGADYPYTKQVMRVFNDLAP
jgi:soluble lytic murein transglycosylase-like protein